MHTTWKLHIYIYKYIFIIMWHFHLQNHQITRLNKSLLTWNELSTVRLETVPRHSKTLVLWMSPAGKFRSSEFVFEIEAVNVYLNLGADESHKTSVFVENINNARLCFFQIPTGNLVKTEIFEKPSPGYPTMESMKRLGTVPKVMKLDGPEDPVNFMGGVQTCGISRL